MQKTTVAAIDLGATSGRVLVGTFSTNGVELTEVHRFANAFHRMAGYDYWGIGFQSTEVRQGIEKAKLLFPDLRSVGVDTWGVDYAMVDDAGRLVFPIHAYRDERTLPIFRDIQAREDDARIYEWTGLPITSFNTALQLAESLQAYPQLKEMCRHVLQMPDFANFLLSGQMVNEISIASSSQLLDVNGTDYHPEALAYFGVPEHFFGKPQTAGRLLGKVKNIPSAADVEVALVPGHDTSCAFEAIPQVGRALLVSTGTWFLTGAIMDKPCLGQAAFAANIANERTGNGGYRPCRNLLGMWLLERIIPSFESRPRNDAEWTALVTAASEAPEPECLLDTQDEALFNPSDMRAAMESQLRAQGAHPPADLAGYMRLICASLGRSVATAAEQMSRITHQPFDSIVMVGGAAKNRLLCQQVADAAHMPVFSYDMEAACLGNMGYQLMALGDIADMSQFHDLVRQEFQGKRYLPQGK